MIVGTPSISISWLANNSSATREREGNVVWVSIFVRVASSRNEITCALCGCFHLFGRLKSAYVCVKLPSLFGWDTTYVSTRNKMLVHRCAPAKQTLYKRYTEVRLSYSYRRKHVSYRIAHFCYDQLCCRASTCKTSKFD